MTKSNIERLNELQEEWETAVKKIYDIWLSNKDTSYEVSYDMKEEITEIADNLLQSLQDITEKMFENNEIVLGFSIKTNNKNAKRNGSEYLIDSVRYIFTRNAVQNIGRAERDKCEKEKLNDSVSYIFLDTITKEFATFLFEDITLTNQDLQIN